MAKVNGTAKGSGNGNGNGNQPGGPPGLAGTTPGQSGNTPGLGGTSPPGQTGATPGQNKAPTDILIDNSSVDENAVGAVIGTLTAIDPNAGDSHTFAVSDARFEVVGGQLKLKAGISLDYETEHSVALSITTTDALGASFTKQITIAVGNVNEQPVIVSASTTATGAISELANTAGSTALDSTNGTIAFGDVDLGDTHTASQSGPTFSWSGGALTAEQVQALTTAGSLTLTQTDSTGSGSGSVGWTYAVTDGALDFLNEGETLTISYGVTVTDNGGASAVQGVTVTINGTADGPQNAAPVAADDLVVGSTAVQPGAPITFESGTYSWNAYGIETADGFQFTNAAGFPYFSQSNLITGFWGVDEGDALYSDGARFDDLSAVDTRPLEMTRVDGGTFSLIGGNFTSWNNNYLNDSLASRIETVTGYLDGVQVAQQSFQVPDGYYVGRLNEVDFTDPGFGSVDRVEFSLVANLTNSSDNFAYQFIDNLQTATTVSSTFTEDQAIIGIDVLANDTDDGAHGDLSIAQFSVASAMGAAITLNPDGTFTYDPTGSAVLQALNTGDAVDDTFTYTVQDAFGAVSNSATVTVHLHGVDEVPIVQLTGVTSGADAPLLSA
jgi:VCBS repeat-containing protein